MDQTGRLVAFVDALAAAAEAGLKEHERWAAARALLARKLTGRRATSRLPALVDYVMTRPIVSAGMIQEELHITPRAAQNLVADFGLARGDRTRALSRLGDHLRRGRKNSLFRYLSALWG